MAARDRAFVLVFRPEPLSKYWANQSGIDGGEGRHERPSLRAAPSTAGIWAARPWARVKY